MIYEKIFLKDVFENINTEATLTVYAHEKMPELREGKPRAGIVICPGGGYYAVSPREAEPIAMAFYNRGYNAFVLRYSTKDFNSEEYPTQLLEISAAIAYTRRNSEYYNTKKDTIAVCGFSAGGHLAGMSATLWQEDIITQKLGIEYGENKPNGLILAYPVITSGEFAHRGSFVNLAGDDADETLLHKLSLENSVGEHTPPTFIWHTLNDGTVPSENSFLFANALKRNGVPFEMHIYPDGCHGLALATLETNQVSGDTVNPHVASWMDLCLAWFARYIDNEGA